MIFFCTFFALTPDSIPHIIELKFHQQFFMGIFPHQGAVYGSEKNQSNPSYFKIIL